MSTGGPGGARVYLLFVYGRMMSGEPDAERLAGTQPLGPAATEPLFDLVDFGSEPALVPGGATSVRGEVYSLSAAQLAAIDVHQGHPLRYRRGTIRLDDGREVEAHQLPPEHARGKRRIRSGDWRAHLAPPTPNREERAWSRWAKQRR